MRVIKSLLIIISLVGINTAIGQSNSTCAGMEPICTDSVLTFNINANSGTGEPGNNYGCLGTQPNPSWFYFEISNAGDINMELTSTHDMDFIIWGPFNNLSAAQNACGNLGNAPNPLGNVDCGFLGGTVEYPDITGASVGEVYVMMITNFSNVSTTFSLAQIGGLGATDCSIVPNACLSDPGTFTLLKNGAPTTAPISLCGGETFAMLSMDDYGLPLDTIAVADGGDGIFTSQLMILVYDAPPTGNDPAVDPGYTGFILPTDTLADINDATSLLIQNLGCGTYYFVPVAGDDGVGANNNVPGINDNGQLHWDRDGNGCFVLGSAIEVTYACAFVATDQVNCAGGNNNVDITLTGQAANVNFVNLGSGILSATNSAVPGTVTLSNLENGDNYQIQVTDPVSGCQQTLNGSFSTPQFVDVSLVPATGCQGNGSVYVQGDPGSGNGGLASIIIEGVVETITTPFDTAHLPAGTAVDITLVDGSGCTTDSSVTIPSASHDIQINVYHINAVSCNGQSDASVWVDAYGYDPSNGNPDGVAITDITWTYISTNQQFPGDETNDTMTNMQPGLWLVTVMDAFGCESSQQIPISNTPALSVQVVSAGDPNCYNESNGSITVGFTGGTPGAGVSYTWSHDPTLNLNTANSLPAGLYNIEVEDVNGCTGSVNYTLNNPPQIQANFSLAHINCYGDSTGRVVVTDVLNLQPQGTSINPQTNLNNVNFYAWDLPGFPDPPLSDNFAGDLPAGDYSIIIGDDAGCTASFDFTLTQNTPLKDSTGTVPAFCRTADFQQGNGVVYSSALFKENEYGGAGNWTYEWVNNETGETTDLTTWNGLEPGSYTVTITDNADCTLERTVYLDSVNPEASFIIESDGFEGPGKYEGTELLDIELINTSKHFSDPNYLLSDSTFKYNMETNRPGGGKWVFNYGYNVTKIDTTLNGEFDYQVCLVAKNFNDCRDTFCEIVKVHEFPGIVAPNVFTPGDNTPNNEFFFPATGIAEFDCSVFNRYGVEVFHFDSIDDKWNGQNKNTGGDCRDGVYFYTYSAMSTNRTPFEGQGTVTILRGKD